MAALVDMHDLGDMLVEAGFADPVMDQETLDA
jgi:malonyl-CoA O-methyltransferase